MSGNVAPRHAHKASKEESGETGGKEGRKQAGNFQVPTLSSFHSRKEGRKEGCRPETSGAAADAEEREGASDSVRRRYILKEQCRAVLGLWQYRQ